MPIDRLKIYQTAAVILILVVASYGILRVTGSYANSIDPTTVRSFTVSAQGDAVAKSDIAQFTYSVLTEGGKDLAKLGEENSTKGNAAKEYLKDQGVAEADIKTVGYNISPRYQYYNCGYETTAGNARPCPPAEIVGYSINETVEVKVRDLKSVGGLISGVVTKGANTVSSVQFTVDDTDAVEKEAREEAFAKARAKAEAIAEAGGFTLGKLIDVQEGGGAIPYPMYATDVKGYGMGGAEVVPEFSAGSNEVNVTVTLRYQIK